MRLLPVLRILAWATLVAGLALPSFAPEMSNAAFLALGAFTLLHLAFVPERLALLRHPSGWMPLAAGLLLLIALSVTAKSALHVAAVLALVHLYMVVPVSGLLGRLGAQLTLGRIGTIAMLGAAGGATAAGIDVFWFGSARGGLVNNPIHLADISLTLGFVSLVGIWGRGWNRWLFLLGPVFGIATVVLSGSRGPLLSAVPMALVACLAWYLSKPRGPAIRRWFLASIALAALVALPSAFLYATGGGGPIETAMTLFGRGAQSDGVRQLLYDAAAKAFLASPVVGHGLIDYVGAAAQYGADPTVLRQFEHLHNDIADFAVAGGSFGLVAYALFLLAPLVGGLRARGQYRVPMLYLGAATTVGYFCMGLTNAVIGMRWLDIVLATVLAILVTLSQSSRTAHDQ